MLAEGKLYRFEETQRRETQIVVIRGFRAWTDRVVVGRSITKR